MKKFYYAEFWNLMKICAAQGFIAVLICGVAIAHDNHAQLLDREISIDVTQVSFDEALKEIARASNAYFSYSPDLVKVNDRITVKADRQTVRKVLNDLLAPLKIVYAVDEDEVTISLKPAPAKRGRSNLPDEKAAIEVSGTVKDVVGEPMPGVNVVAKGTSFGTTTDENGYYAMSVEPSDILVFSFIGYQSVEQRVGNRTTIDVTLNEDVKNLEEVIVNVGYWEVKQKEQTGNVVRITSEQIEKQPINNTLQSLQGRLTGVYITQTTGVPGGGFKIQIRGQNSLRNDANNPLYIVDGVPFTSNSLSSPALGGLIITEGNPLSAINPADIESIEVLKDADATSIYGSRGSNGVILITTKKGKAGKTKLDMNVSTGLGQVSSNLSLLNTSQHLAMRKQALQNDGYWPLPEEYYSLVPDVFLWDTTRYTNWQRELIGGTAKTTNARLSLSGGSDRTKFLLAGGYYKETTVFPGDFSFQRFSGSLGLNHTSENQKLNLSTSINYTANINRLMPVDLTSRAVSLPPNAPALYNDDGTINWDWQNDDMQNPVSNMLKMYRNTTNNFVSNATISYQVAKGLQVKSSMGYTSMQVAELATSPIKAIPTHTLAGQTGSASFGDANINTWIVEPQASYTRAISRGTLNLILGSTVQHSEQSSQTISARGYASDALLENIRAATSWDISSSSNYKYRYAALFARANYSWDEKYILNLTARRDGSSRFGTGNRFGNFGAVGVAWIFSNENFLKDGNTLSFGKLRASYGVTGSDAIGNYQYLPTYSPTQYPYNGQSALTLTRLSNPDYSWESNRKFEVGVDLGFFEDRIFFDASYYRNRSSNQLVGLPLPIMTGQSSVQFNLPATVENTGLELQLRTMNVKQAKFSWQTTFNVTLPRNELIEFPNIKSFPAYSNQFQVGKSVYTRKTLIATGVDPETGVYTFKDVDGDGNISFENDGQFVKQLGQRYYGGMNNSIKYAGFQLDVFVQFVKQTGYSYIMSYPSPGSFSNQPSVVTDRWQKPGDQTAIQQYSLVGDGSMAYLNYMSSDRAIVDASFIRIKNVSLSWDLPEKWINKSILQSCRFYLIGQNLFTFTNFLGLDPESQNVNFLPPLRMVSFGANVTF